jgi:aryl-alcohol dehydrogenase-like predicted oxidoreductase
MSTTDVGRIALGTVQLGMAYGVANATGQVSEDDAHAIVSHAVRSGIDTLDTCVTYGDSEQRLGRFGIQDCRVTSKLPALPDDAHDVAAYVTDTVEGSLRRLRIGKLHGLLLRRSSDLLGQRGAAVYEALVALKKRGLVEKVGASIYDPSELDALAGACKMDLLQAPFNIFDRRLETSGWLARLSRAGVEIHTRSVFLQGLLLMAPQKRPPTFGRWEPLWERWDSWLDAVSLSPVQACIGFALSRPKIDRIVVGVDSVNQLQEVLDAVDAPRVDWPGALMSEDLDLINPTRWLAA